MTPTKDQLRELLDLYNLKNYEEAETLGKLITNRFPNHQFGWKILGAIYAHLGKLGESLNANLNALRINPKDHEAQNNLGNIFLILGKLDDAETSLRKAISIKYNYPEAHNNLGNTLKNLNKLEEAENTLRKAISLKSNYAEAYNNLGNVLLLLGRLEEAEVSLRQSINLNSNNPNTFLNLCEILDKNNKLDELLKVVKKGKKRFVNNKSDFLFYEAFTYFRLEIFDKVESILEKINKNELTQNRILGFLKLKADFSHFKKDYENAFQSYKEMNDTIKNSKDYKNREPKKYFNHQLKKIDQINELQKSRPYMNDMETPWPQPIFLIGFPRSGTTLIDSILRSHSKIDVIEEKPMLHKIYTKIGYLSEIADIENIDYKSAKIASEIYLNEAKKYCKIDKNLILIDKFPLNIFEVPLIHRIFPNSKIILALRHPYDCILSCWMQNFRLNHAMANMVDLDIIVELYINAMHFFHLCKKRYKIDIVKVRYEDLVSNFNYEVNNLLSFIGLEWEEELNNYHKSALLRNSINTPSYLQVIKPLYQNASFRWLKYKKNFIKYNKKISPWINEFGYN